MITTMTLDFATSGLAEGYIPLTTALRSQIMRDLFPDLSIGTEVALINKGVMSKSVKVSMTLDTTGIIPVIEESFSMSYDEAVDYANKMFSKARLNVGNPRNPNSKIRTIINNGRSLTFEIPLNEFEELEIGSATPLVRLEGLVGGFDENEKFIYVPMTTIGMTDVVRGLSVIATFQIGTDFGFSTQENRTFHAQSSKNLHPIEFTHNKTLGEQQYYHVKNKPYTVLEGVVDTRTIRSKKNYQEVL